MHALSKDDIDTIFFLASKLTGAVAKPSEHNVIVQNVLQRMFKTKKTSLEEYLEYVHDMDNEFSHLLSALTIHTTSWFREPRLFEVLADTIADVGSRSSGGKLYRVLSAACSTGEEVYSIAMVLEGFRRLHPDFDYYIEGWDVDPVSIHTATKGIYPEAALGALKDKFKNLMTVERMDKTERMDRTERMDGQFVIPKIIKQRCRFEVVNLLESRPVAKETFDLIACRNVLIYFDKERIDHIVQNLRPRLHAKGMFCFGVSDAIDADRHNISLVGSGIYKPKSMGVVDELTESVVLVVDDSKSVQRVLARLIESGGMRALCASSAREADEVLSRTKAIDLITLDLNMPEVDGISWLKQKRLEGLTVPVSIVSDASLEGAKEVVWALEHGAQDFIGKASLADEKASILERFGALIHASRERKKVRPSLSSHRAPSILLVDGEGDTARVVSGVLTNAGYVICHVRSGVDALQKCDSERFDFIMSEGNMRDMTGFQLCRALRAREIQMPFLIITETSTDEMFKAEAKTHGCTAVFSKPISAHELLASAAQYLPNQEQEKQKKTELRCPDVVLLGASTGGTETLVKLLQRMPPQSPPVLVVQHILPVIAKDFAARLCNVSGLTLGDIHSGSILKQGHIYIALGDYHLALKRQDEVIALQLSDSGPIHGHRPSVDHLFFSAASLAGTRIAAALLTGMGRDGASGLAQLKSRGAITFAQDEASCVVFGMPKEAIKLGGAMFVLNPSEIRDYLDTMMANRKLNPGRLSA